MATFQNVTQEEWVKILTKGVITLPKKMRDQLGIKEGDIAKMKIEDNRIIIEPKKEKTFDDVRIYTKKEIEEWIQEDILPAPLGKEVDDYWKNLP